jgi:hypothetical protein
MFKECSRKAVIIQSRGRNYFIYDKERAVSCFFVKFSYLSVTLTCDRKETTYYPCFFSHGLLLSAIVPVTGFTIRATFRFGNCCTNYDYYYNPLRVVNHHIIPWACRSYYKKLIKQPLYQSPNYAGFKIRRHVRSQWRKYQQGRGARAGSH